MLQARVKDNPRDRGAKKELQLIMKSYETKLKDAIDAGEFDIVSGFIEEAKFIAPRSLRLKAFSKKVDKMKKEQAQNAN